MSILLILAAFASAVAVLTDRGERLQVEPLPGVDVNRRIED